MADRNLQELTQSAARAQGAGDLVTATRLYRQALTLAPGHPALLNSLGVTALKAGDTATALASLSEATSADPASPVLWVNLAKAQREAGDSAAERDSLDRALAIDGLHFPALVRKAELHERQGDRVEAMRLWQGILATAPDAANPEVARMLDHARSYIGEQSAAFARAVDRSLEKQRREVDPAALRRFDACVAAGTGRRRIYVNECAGTHFPFLPADEFFAREHFPWFEALEAASEAIRGELEALIDDTAPGFAPYVQLEPGAPPNKWTPLSGKTTWNAYFLYKFGRPIAPALERCPETARALASVHQLMLEGRSPNAFFSILEPGGVIPPHTGVTNTRAIVHLPLIVPPHCTFRVGGETRAWVAGEAFAFDDTIEHEARNASDALRAVLILDVWNPHLTAVEREMIGRYFAAADQAGFGDPELANG